MLQIWDDILSILKAPFVGDLDLTQLFVLVGVVLFFIACWVLILQHFKIAAMEV